MKKKLVVLSGFVMSLAPIAVFAQAQTGGLPATCGSQIGPDGLVRISTLQGILCKISEILGAILPVLIALGVLYFVYGVVTYMIGSDEEAKKKGRDRIIYGVIGLAVIVTVWGLVAILRNTFGLSNIQRINFPTTPY